MRKGRQIVADVVRKLPDDHLRMCLAEILDWRENERPLHKGLVNEVRAWVDEGGFYVPYSHIDIIIEAVLFEVIERIGREWLHQRESESLKKLSQLYHS